VTLTVSELVELLGVRERDVRRWIEREGLPAVVVHGVCRIHRSELFDWAAQNAVPLPHRFFAVAGEMADPAVFEKALSNGGFSRLAAPADRRALARAIVAALPLPAGEQAMAAEIVASRESLGFVAVRGGIALPRVCEPLIVDGPAAVAICAFDAPIHEPDLDAAVVIAVAAPTLHAHHLLVEDLHAMLDRRDLREALARGEAGELGSIIGPATRASEAA
jgi:PTS system nitrogen regulatory IIA component